MNRWLRATIIVSYFAGVLGVFVMVGLHCAGCGEEGEGNGDEELLASLGCVDAGVVVARVELNELAIVWTSAGAESDGSGEGARAGWTVAQWADIVVGDLAWYCEDERALLAFGTTAGGILVVRGMAWDVRYRVHSREGK